ncbi:MAG: DDE-type integrase/transposase/recombinase [Kofleriaceae bacterium]|nr:DDE-type integrase/transposase/recombinase [Kofleriaceae bacterium]
MTSRWRPTCSTASSRPRRRTSAGSATPPELLTASGKSHLAAIVDLYARFVVGWAVSAVNDRHLTLAALGQALRRRCPEVGLLHHSDQGSTYASEDYQEVLRAHGITCSMSRRGNCHDNAAMESWFSTKFELGETFASIRHGKDEAFTYIEAFTTSAAGTRRSATWRRPSTSGGSVTRSGRRPRDAARERRITKPGARPKAMDRRIGPCITKPVTPGGRPTDDPKGTLVAVRLAARHVRVLEQRARAATTPARKRSAGASTSGPRPKAHGRDPLPDQAGGPRQPALAPHPPDAPSRVGRPRDGDVTKTVHGWIAPRIPRRPHGMGRPPVWSSAFDRGAMRTGQGERSGQRGLGRNAGWCTALGSSRAFATPPLRADHQLVHVERVRKTSPPPARCPRHHERRRFAGPSAIARHRDVAPPRRCASAARWPRCAARSEGRGVSRTSFSHPVRRCRTARVPRLLREWAQS